MATISVGKDGYVVCEAGKGANNHAAVRGASTGTLVNHTAASYSSAVMYLGDRQYVIIRSFFFFDTSGISSAVASVTLNMRGSTYSSADVIAIKSTAFGGDGGTALATSDFYAEIDYSTPYSSELTTWTSVDNNNEYTLNAAALADIKNNDHFTLALVDHDSDYANSEPGGSSYAADVNVKLATTITLDYTVVSGYANTVKGVASANIGKVNGVATASISKVNGI